jgi:hypothetical protein
MPTGVYYSKEFRRLLLAATNENLEIELFVHLFRPCLDDPNISIEHITNVYNRMKRDPIWAYEYAYCPRARIERNRRLNVFEENILISTNLHNNGATYRTLIREFDNLMTGEQHHQGFLSISRNTACRIQHRSGITGKVPEYRNINGDETERLTYLEQIVYVDPELLVDIDETS